MPLNTIGLKAQLKLAFLANLPAPTTAQIAQVDTLCGSIANALQAFVESATITYTTGLTTASGPVTGVLGNVIT